MVIVLRIWQADNGWQLVLDDAERSARRGTVPTAVVDDVTAEVRTLQARPAMTDPIRARRERQMGVALWTLLEACPPVASRFSWALGRSSTSRPIVVIDAVDAEVRALPWELLCWSEDAAPLEASGTAVIARLLPTDHLPASAPPVASLRIAAWSPTPSDPVCASRLAQLDELGATDLEDDVQVLHVVCHGARVADDVALLLDEGQRSAASLSHGLSSRWPRLRLVVLDVCNAASATPSVLDSMVGRLIDAGAPACIAPHTAFAADAAGAFTTGLYRALGGGAALAEAVVAGRREVAMAARPEPEARWSVLRLFVGSTRTLLAEAPVQRLWSPHGWPSPGVRAARLLDRARTVAERHQLGYLGVEHLLLAMVELGVAHPQAALFDRLRGPVLASFEPLEVQPGKAAKRPHRSPRMKALATSLHAGFGVEELWEAILDDATTYLPVLAGRSLVPTSRRYTTAGADTWGVLTLSESGRSHHDAPGQRLVVLGGPEDGRVLSLRPGDTLGRYVPDPPAVHALFHGTRATDPSLSRIHATWHGEGRLTLRKPGRIQRHGETRSAKGDLELVDGDVVHLTAATRLLVQE